MVIMQIKSTSLHVRRTRVRLPFYRHLFRVARGERAILIYLDATSPLRSDTFRVSPRKETLPVAKKFQPRTGVEGKI